MSKTRLDFKYLATVNFMKGTKEQVNSAYNIDGNCKITYGNGTIDVKNGKADVKGLEVKNGFIKGMDESTMSIFDEIAGMDFHHEDITQGDLEQFYEVYIGDARKKGGKELELSLNALSARWGIKDIRYDKDAGVMTLHLNSGKTLRFDFETAKEKKAGKPKQKTAEKPKTEAKQQKTGNVLYNDLKSIGAHYGEIVAQTKLGGMDEKQTKENLVKMLKKYPGMKINKIRKDGDKSIVTFVITTNDNKTREIKYKNGNELVSDKEVSPAAQKKTTSTAANKPASTSQAKPSQKAKPAAKTSRVNKTNTSKTVKTNKYSDVPKEWIVHIQNTAKKYGYSEDLIITLALAEGYTPVAQWKNEDGGLWEVGFGHTTKADHNNNFGKNFKISLGRAFDWLGQDIKDKEEHIAKEIGIYYDYKNLPPAMKECMIDVAFNRGQGRLNPKSNWFDSRYNSVIANIENGNIGSAAVRLRQEEFKNPLYEPGLRKRNVYRFLRVMDYLMKKGKAKEVKTSMDLFNREYYYFTTLKKLRESPKDSTRAEAAPLQKAWEEMYNRACNESP